MNKYDKMKESKDAYKTKVEQYVAVLRRITNSSRNVEPIVASIEEPLVQTMGKYYLKGKIMYDFF
jgi:hypothetical protein